MEWTVGLLEKTEVYSVIVCVSICVIYVQRAGKAVDIHGKQSDCAQLPADEVTPVNVTCSHY